MSNLGAEKAFITIIFVVVALTFLFPYSKYFPLDRRVAGLLGAACCTSIIWMCEPDSKTLFNPGSLIDCSVLVILIAIMIMNNIVMDQPLLRQAIKTMQLYIRYNIEAGFYLVCTIAFVAAPLVTNDGLCILLVDPVLDGFLPDPENLLDLHSELSNSASIDILREDHLSNRFYFMLGIACSANLGSVMTYTGNPQNIIISQYLQSQMTGGQFFGYMFIPAISTWILTIYFINYRRKRVVTDPCIRRGEYIPSLSQFVQEFSDFSKSVSQTFVDLVQEERTGRSMKSLPSLQKQSSSPSSPHQFSPLHQNSTQLQANPLPSSSSSSSSSSPLDDIEDNKENETNRFNSNSNIEIIINDLEGEEVLNGEMKEEYISEVQSNSPSSGSSPSSSPSQPSQKIIRPRRFSEKNPFRPQDLTRLPENHPSYHPRKDYGAVVSFPLIVWPLFFLLILFELIGIFPLICIYSLIAIFMLSSVLLMNYYFHRPGRISHLSSYQRIELMTHYVEQLFLGLDYNLLIIFSGLFMVAGSFVRTGIPAQIFYAFAGGGGGSGGSGKQQTLSPSFFVFIMSIYTILVSQLVGNVPLVIMVSGQINSLPPAQARFGWLIVSWVSTIAGNFTLTGSAANIIVAEKALRHGAKSQSQHTQPQKQQQQSSSTSNSPSTIPNPLLPLSTPPSLQTPNTNTASSDNLTSILDSLSSSNLNSLVSIIFPPSTSTTPSSSSDRTCLSYHRTIKEIFLNSQQQQQQQQPHQNQHQASDEEEKDVDEENNHPSNTTTTTLNLTSASSTTSLLSSPLLSHLKPSSARVNITAIEHFKVCGVITLISIVIGACILSVEAKIMS